MRKTLFQIARNVGPVPGYRDGGPIRGPGTSTSDSIPARLSKGEFVLPADTVRKVGVKSLRDLVHRTHMPSGKPHHPARFVDGGGPVDDENKRPNSFGDAAAAARDPSVAQVGAAPAGQPPVAPAPAGPSLAAAAFPNTARAIGGAMDDARSAYQQGGLGAALGQSARVMGAPLIGLADDVATGAKTVLNPAAQALKTFATGDPTPIGQAAPTNAGTDAGAGSGRMNPQLADLSKPLSSPAASSASMPGASSGYGPIGDRSTLTNEQAAVMNPAGRITVTRGANGTMEFSGGNVSGQVSYNDPSGKALPGGGLNGKGFSAFDVAPAGANVAMGPNGSYALSTSGSGTSSTVQGTGARSPDGTAVGQVRNPGLPGNTQPGTQNLNAGGNLAASQEQGARARLMAAGMGPGSGPVAPGSFTGGYSGVIGSADTRGNMLGRSPEQQRRDAEVSASSIHKPTAERGRADLTRLNSQDLQQERNAGDLAVMAAQQQGQSARERLIQAGQLQRTGIESQRYDEANQIARGRLTLKQIAAGYTNRSADRIDRAQSELENAKTPEAQRSARERLLALAGKAPQNEWGVQVTPTTKNPDGSTTHGSVYRYNKTTGETVRVDDGQGNGAPPPSKDSLKAGQVYQTRGGPLRWNGTSFERVG